MAKLIIDLNDMQVKRLKKHLEIEHPITKGNIKLKGIRTRKI